MVTASSNGFTPEIVSWYEAFLDNFSGEQRRKSKTDADVICPVHDDHDPSLGVDLRENGRGPKIVMNCRSQGCEYEEILDALGVSTSDLAYQENGKPKGCTLEQYAKAKGLPVEFLEGDTVGLQNTSWWGVDAVEIPYVDEEGDYVLSRYRVTLTGKTKVVSKKGDPVMPYGLHYLEDAREAGYVLLVEGESDCHSAWYRGIPAVGIPGAKNWKQGWAEYFDGIDRILVLVEPDGGGEELWENVSGTKALRGRLGRIDP
jgi:transcriptional regulator with XRE-family HTH domain